MRNSILFVFVCFLLFAGVVSASPQSTIEKNLGVDAGDMILFILVCACFVIGAFDWRVALMIFFLVNTVCYILFFALTEAHFHNVNPNHAGILLVTSIALLALTLLITFKKQQQGIV